MGHHRQRFRRELGAGDPRVETSRRGVERQVHHPTLSLGDRKREQHQPEKPAHLSSRRIITRATSSRMLIPSSSSPGAGFTGGGGVTGGMFGALMLTR